MQNTLKFIGSVIFLQLLVLKDKVSLESDLTC